MADELEYGPLWREPASPFPFSMAEKPVRWLVARLEAGVGILTDAVLNRWEKRRKR